jgi:hypothetical protein
MGKKRPRERTTCKSKSRGPPRNGVRFGLGEMSMKDLQSIPCTRSVESNKIPGCGRRRLRRGWRPWGGRDVVRLGQTRVPGVPSQHRSPPISPQLASVLGPRGLPMSSGSAGERMTTRQQAAGSLGNGQGLQRGGHAGICHAGGVR